MPAERRNELKHLKQPKKRLSEGEKFALALGLEDKEHIFHQCKKEFRRMADNTFDFDLPLFQQTEAMEIFVKEAVAGFPGYFSDRHENIKDRIKYLEQYAVSYLQKSGKMTVNTNVNKDKKKKHKLSETTPPPTVIKVERPKPKPLYRGKTDTAPPPPPLSPPAEVIEAECPKPPSRGKTAIALAAPSSPPPPPASPSPPSTPAAPATTTTSTSDAVLEFLAACLPSMQHLAATFQAAGVLERHHLEGVAKWDEEIKHNFIKNRLAHNPMEVQAITSGFAALLN